MANKESEKSKFMLVCPKCGCTELVHYVLTKGTDRFKCTLCKEVNSLKDMQFIKTL